MLGGDESPRHECLGSSEFVQGLLSEAVGKMGYPGKRAEMATMVLETTL